MEFKDAVYNVVKSLRLYEKDFTSAKRTPVDYQVRVKSLSEYIECRLNFESFKIDSLRRYEEIMDGYLFSVDSIFDVNGNSYSRVIIKIGEKPDILSSNDYENIINEVSKIIGGNKLSFSSNKNNLELSVM